MASFTGKIGTPSNGFTLKVNYTYTQDSEKTTITSISGAVKRNDSSFTPYNTTKNAVLTVKRLDDTNSWITAKTLKSTSSYSISSDSYYTWVSGSNIEIPHKTDGTQKLRLTFEVDGKLSNYYPKGSITSDITLPTIEMHEAPSDIEYTITEINPLLVSAGVPSDTFVNGLSIKRFNVTNYNLYDDATLSVFKYYERTFNLLSYTENPFVVDYLNTYQMYPLEAEDGTKTIQYSIGVEDSLGYRGWNNRLNNPYIPYFKPIFSSTTKAKRNGQTTGNVLLNVQGSFYNALIGNITNNIASIQYKIWNKEEDEPSDTNYITIPSNLITINGNAFSVSNCEIGLESTISSYNFDYEQSYEVKVKVVDLFEQDAEILTGGVPVGEATWTEYKDRVDFKKITVQGKELSSTDVQLNGESIVTDGVANISKTVSMSVSTKTLKSGFSTTATTVDFTEYIGVYIRVLPSSGAAYVPLFIPANLITTTATSYQGADESNWVSLSLQKSGTDIIILGKGRSSTSGNYAVYGVKLNGTIEVL